MLAVLTFTMAKTEATDPEEAVVGPIAAKV
jgi:hypothetical protein